jgi:hypothetical protein
MEHHYATVRMQSWTDFKKFVDQLSENWAFRGQANSEWVLNNAIERTDFISYYKGVEGDFVSEFQRGARNYLSRDEIPQHLIEWLALMQHHGAPTRLLDLTRSPFTAAYFAYEQAEIRDGAYAAIWGINITYLKNRALEIFNEEFREALLETKNMINESIFEKIFYENNRSLVFPVEPFRMNRRYSLQQSIFLSTGTSTTPFMEQLNFLGTGLSKSVIKIEVPAWLKKEVLRDLQKMNLHRASLFPDLDGYALSLKLRYDSQRTPEEILQHNIDRLQDLNYPFIP